VSVFSRTFMYEIKPFNHTTQSCMLHQKFLQMLQNISLEVNFLLLAVSDCMLERVSCTFVGRKNCSYVAKYKEFNNNGKFFNWTLSCILANYTLNSNFYMWLFLGMNVYAINLCRSFKIGVISRYTINFSGCFKIIFGRKVVPQTLLRDKWVPQTF
jgi:hypothetical protein